MSASIITEVVFAIYLAVGAPTEDAMREDVWIDLGLCDPRPRIRPCDHADGSKECAELNASNKPCSFDLFRSLSVFNPEVYRRSADRPPRPAHYELHEPRWQIVPDKRGWWWKVQL